MTDKSDITLKFSGASKQVNADTFLNSLFSLVNIIEEINRVWFKNQKVDMKLSAPSAASFNVTVNLTTTSYDPVVRLINPEKLKSAGTILGLVGDIYEFRNFLNGRKPDRVKTEGDDIEVYNQDGKQRVINRKLYTLYHSNQTINDSLNRQFESLYTDAAVSAFELAGPGSESLFKADHEIFSCLSRQEKFEQMLPEGRMIKIRTFLSIFKIIFDDKYRWEFIYKGNRINARILDEGFYKNVDRGEKFSKGDSLEVELEITQTFDESVNVYLNKGYTINKVYAHRPRESQVDLEI